jgi:hypothetical protein
MKDTLYKIKKIREPAKYWLIDFLYKLDYIESNLYIILKKDGKLYFKYNKKTNFLYYDHSIHDTLINNYHVKIYNSGKFIKNIVEEYLNIISIEKISITRYKNSKYFKIFSV